MRELTLRVAEKEVRSIGEGRWLRACWKRSLLLPVICLVAMIIVSVVIPDGVTKWYKAIIIAPLAVGFFISYYRFFRALDRAGKELLEEVKSGQRESG